MKIRSLLITVALLIAVTILILQRSQISKLTADLESARQSSEPAAVDPGNTNPAPQVSAMSSDDSAELLRLRAEVTALHRQTNELARVRSENAEMRAALVAASAKPANVKLEQDANPERAQIVARLGDSRIYALALILHFQDNERFATNIAELAPYLPNGGGLTGTNQFDIVLQGSRQGITNASGIILVRELQPHQQDNGSWTRAYGFLDGHSEIHKEPTSNFDDFERSHLWPPGQ